MDKRQCFEEASYVLLFVFIVYSYWKKTWIFNVLTSSKIYSQSFLLVNNTLMLSTSIIWQVVSKFIKNNVQNTFVYSCLTNVVEQLLHSRTHYTHYTFPTCLVSSNRTSLLSPCCHRRQCLHLTNLLQALAHIYLLSCFYKHIVVNLYILPVFDVLAWLYL